MIIPLPCDILNMETVICCCIVLYYIVVLYEKNLNL